jgi:hypothetical protein
MWVKWKLVSVHLEIVLVGARYVHGLGLIYHRLGNHFGQMMGLLGDVGQMEARFGLF